MDTLELVFAIVNYSVLPAWVLLVVAPRWQWTCRIVHAGVIPLVLGGVYGVLLFSDQPGPQGSSFFTLDGVMRIFTSRQTVIACWAHYLIFDLFVGAWIARDARRLELPHLAIVPSLVLTLLFGPLGLVSYLGIRLVMRRRLTLAETWVSPA